VLFVSLRSLVGVVVPEDGLTADLAEVQAVRPATRVRGVVFRLPDGDIDDVARFNILPVGDGRVGRHPLTYVTISIGLSLWAGVVCSKHCDGESRDITRSEVQTLFE
jgi:hypothetical protein